jgi:hypothetical protein
VKPNLSRQGCGRRCMRLSLTTPCRSPGALRCSLMKMRCHALAVPISGHCGAGAAGWPTTMKMRPHGRQWLDGAARLPIVMARLVRHRRLNSGQTARWLPPRHGPARPSPPAGAATDGPDEPGHDEEAASGSVLTPMQLVRAMTERRAHDTAFSYENTKVHGGARRFAGGGNLPTVSAMPGRCRRFARSAITKLAPILRDLAVVPGQPVLAQAVAGSSQ